MCVRENRGREREKEGVRGRERKRESHKQLFCHSPTSCTIFVNIVNQRLADGDVNCTCGNNMTPKDDSIYCLPWRLF